MRAMLLRSFSSYRASANTISFPGPERLKRSIFGIPFSALLQVHQSDALEEFQMKRDTAEKIIAARGAMPVGAGLLGGIPISLRSLRLLVLDFDRRCSNRAYPTDVYM
jgi:hypothetical protein